MTFRRQPGPAGVLWATAWALWLSACAGQTVGPAFDLSRHDNRRAELSVLDATGTADAASPTADEPAIVVYTDAAPAQLKRYRLGEGTPQWERTVALDVRPIALSDTLLSAAGPQLVALNADTGEDRFRRAMAEPVLLGATRVADTLVVVTTRRDPPARSAVTGLDAHTGTLRFEHRVDGRVGQPTAVGDRVLLPWNAQFLVALDASSGLEVARLRSRHGRITWVRSQPDGVYLGDEQIHRGIGSYLTGDEGAGRGGPVGTQLPLADLPGAPLPYPSGFESVPAQRSAYGRVGAHFRLIADDNGTPTVAEDALFLVYYRHVYGLDDAGRPRWARVLDHDVVAAQAVPGGLWVVTAAGEALQLAEGDGSTAARIPLASAGATAPEPLASAVLVRASGQLQQVLNQSEQAAPTPPTPLREQLLSVALDTDSRLVPSREFALFQLAQRPEPDVTRDLIDIYQQTTTPRAMKEEVKRLLTTRSDGSTHLLQALDQRYDFLEQSKPAPLELLVPALVTLGERAAVPRLAARLFDHETGADKLLILVTAIESLGGKSAIPLLSRFVRLYRADSFAAQHPAPFVAASEALLRLAEQHADPGTRVLLQALADDPRTVAPLRTPLLASLAPAPAPTAPTAPPASPTAPQKPLRLSQEAINGTFADLADDVRACALDELGRNPELAQLRIAFVLDAQGRARTRTYAPDSADLTACLDPKVAGLQFPATQARQQLGDYVVALRTRPQPPEPRTDGDGWWAPYVESLDERPATSPWWQNRNPWVHRVDRGYEDAQRAEATDATGATPEPQPSQSAATARTGPPLLPPSWASPGADKARPASGPKPTRQPPANPPPANPAPAAAPPAGPVPAVSTTAPPAAATDGSQNDSTSGSSDRSQAPDTWWLPSEPTDQ